MRNAPHTSRRHASGMTIGNDNLTFDVSGSLRHFDLRHGRRNAIIALCLLAALIVSLASAARADAAGYLFKGTVAVGGTDGIVTHRNRLAVDQTTGDVYIADVVNDRIVVYRPNGTTLDELTSFGTGELTDPFGVAVNSSTGSVYVSDAGNNRIVRYTTDGAPTPAFTLDATFTSPASGTGAAQLGDFAAPLAVDSTGKLVVADKGNQRVKRFTSSGAYDNLSFDGSGPGVAPFDQLQDLAVDATGDVLVVDADGDPGTGATSRVLRYGADGTYEATVGPVAGAATVAVRPGTDTVLISGNQDSVNRDQRPTVFEWEGSDTLVGQLPIGEDAKYDSVSGIGAGPGGRTYVAMDVSLGSYPGGYGSVSIQVFEPAVPPLVDGQPAAATEVTYGAALLTGSANPRGSSGTLRFEYGKTTAYGTTTTPFDIGGGDGDVMHSERVAGLEPETTYHFRVIADNGTDGPVAGADQTFTTTTAPPAISSVQAVDVTPTSVTLQAEVDPRGLASTYRFAIAGVDVVHRQSGEEIAGAVNGSPYTASTTLTGLPAGATFAVTLHTTSAMGATVENTFTFTTPGQAPYIPPPPGVDPETETYGCLNCGWPPSAIVASPPSNDFTLGKVSVKGAVATVSISVPGAGRLTISGSGLKAVAKKATKKGTVKVTVRLSAVGLRSLRAAKSKHLRRTAKVAFTPTGGTSATDSLLLTFNRKGSR